MLISSVASCVILTGLWIMILITTQFILMKKTSFEHYYCILSNTYQNNNKMECGFPPTSGQISPSSGYCDWLKRDPHNAYRVNLCTIVRLGNLV